MRVDSHRHPDPGAFADDVDRATAPPPPEVVQARDGQAHPGHFAVLRAEPTHRASARVTRP